MDINTDSWSDDDDILCEMSDNTAIKRSSSTLIDKSSAYSTEKKKSWVSSAFDDFDNSGQSTNEFQPLTKIAREKEASSCTISDKQNTARGRKKQTLAVDELWAEKHAPKTQTDLAVHKKKIAEVQGWLEHALRAKPGQSLMLLLTGPSGCGKTATVKALASDLSLDIHEWINPITSVKGEDFNWNKEFSMDRQSSFDGATYQSQSVLFQDFLLRANKYPSLSLGMENIHSGKMILVEDYPNIFYRETQQFHNILRLYKKRGRCPLVFIMSDSTRGDSSERKLLPINLQAEIGLATISFNPVAPTSLIKALSQIASKETSANREFYKVPDKAALDTLSAGCAGDIRAAINALQFACMRAGPTGNGQIPSKTRRWSAGPTGNGQIPSKTRRWSGLALQDVSSTVSLTTKRTTSSSKRTGNGKRVASRARQAKTSNKTGDAAAIGARDSSLFLFRALGKILYCKRGDPEEYSDLTQLPDHLSHHKRDPLLEDPEEVVERSHLSGEFFTAYLHQNYLEFYDELDDVVSASEYFSDSDALTVNWATRQALLQYSSSVSTRGLMFCNTSRAQHQPAGGGGGGGGGKGWRPLHKPQWYTVRKKMRENCEAASALFKGVSQTPEDLQTQFLPYIQLIGPVLQAPGQSSYLREIGRIGSGRSNRPHNERLDERDVDSLDAEESQGGYPAMTSSQQTAATEPESHLVRTDADDEELVIEDYDDD